MQTPRRFLPSISGLRALEALDRLGTATAVAEELSQSQSAISRQLSALETQLGVTLIERERQRMQLTPAARDYAAEIRAALGQISRASMRLAVNPEGGALTLAILPSFGMHWLVPRLPDFARRHPGITVNMGTRLRPFDFAREGFDAAIHHGRADWPGAEHLRLRRERLLAVAAPDFLARHDIAKPADLLGLPLLHIETRPSAWADWMAGYGIRTRLPAGTQYDQFATITQAARHGLGVALLPDFLAEAECAAGRLAPAYGEPRPAPTAYYLVWPQGARTPSLARFRDWLAAQAEEEDPLPR